ncbi:cytochrome P450 [Aspergillus udagawae]|uniref:Cytochrome p450 n=1 Tax=Aspergillus udagawae TaxID=91492 RepID=A0A8E0QZQ2_9EURO|nr:cytochrome p450 [Aspergillus udagawae]GIC94412.1 cytochrome p450 [Aspergillus udagawae]
MLGMMLLLGLLASLFFRFVIWAIFVYLRDPKGLRKYPLLHPLSGISDIPFMLESMRGFRSATLLQLHYGQGHPIIRLGPNALSFAGGQAIPAIYGHSTPTTKDRQYLNAAGSHFHLADVVDRKEHARKRKVLASAFAAKHLEDWEYKVADKVHRLMQRFDQHLVQMPDDPLDYRSWTNLFTIDSLCDICLSERLNCIDRGTDSVTAEDLAGRTKEVSFRDCLYATFHIVGDLVWSYEWYHVVSWVLQRVSRQYARLSQLGNGWSQLVHHLTKRRWERYVRDEPISDIFAALMEDPAGNPQDLEWGEVLAEISLAISGSSSTSNSIASTMQLLIENPDKMRKLQEEVDSVMPTQLDDNPDGDAPTVASYDQIKSLPYLRAVIDESLRLYPPISHGLPRETPKEGMMIMDEWVAGNTTVSVSAYVAHRDPAVFDQPESFVPERWLGEQGRALQSRFIAFSAGARGCIGRPISYLQASILLASLVHRYDFQMWDSRCKPSRRETMNLIMGPMPVRIQKRSS